MNRVEVLAALHREQRDALDLWRSLTANEWTRPSLCEGWTVKDVIVHCIKGESELFQPNLRRALAGDASAPPDFQLGVTNQQQIERHRAITPATLIEEGERAVASSHEMLSRITDEHWDLPSWNPITPGTVGFYVKGRIWEWWTHGQDIRVPLHRPGGREVERTTPVVEVIRDGITGVFIPERSKGVHVSYGFQIGPTEFTVRIDDGTCHIDPEFDRKATARVKADPATFALVGTRRIPQMRAVLTRKFKPSGNPIAGLKFLNYFRAP